MVNNISETFNSVLVGPRQKSIVTVLEDIRGYLMVCLATNKVKMDNYLGSGFPYIKEKLDKEQEMSKHWTCRYEYDLSSFFELVN